MTLFIENELEEAVPEEVRAWMEASVQAVCDYVECPYDYEVGITVTDNAGIRELNLEHRGKDTPTDVLSFPMTAYPEPGDFALLEEDTEAFNPDTGELVLGDMVLSLEKAKEQAEDYGHSLEREVSFLVVHSMLHLFGYDHEEPRQEERMLQAQKEVLARMGVGR
ncbi:rRNA maturation RNase YbeY [Anaerotalea alkaliphila]|uniref:Endoribonuclease YbeY n=1 Tax=Anaerotalea alkaliphila TaxID=2662126 RepID=A0A7X5HWX2_9FIRM|nr:rRNA maturation RNase YbeY [Anaerotalea alkaliphila]NDL68155.1 rRNA maturation RNase YbeY [Anaerotalea alkaliphila]